MIRSTAMIRSFASALGRPSCVFRTSVRAMSGPESDRLMTMEDKFTAHNYHPLPVVFSKAQGVHVWDPEGKHYFDFLSAYSAVNQGHCHPKIVKALQDQAGIGALASRAFYNNRFPPLAQFVNGFFGYESFLPMNTGAEAVESSIKIARKYAYDVRKLPKNSAIILSACGCFHGRTLNAISMSCDPDAIEGFGPLASGHDKVVYNDLKSLEEKLIKHKGAVAAFIVEPIQGEAGVVVPADGYLTKAKELCHKHGALFIADEIQTGLARSGKMLASDYDGVRPDMVLLGKALSGGMYPISAVLADKKIMNVLKPGTHGSTFGGNQLASVIAMAALQVLKDEKLAENAFTLGELFRTELRKLNSPLIKTVRGKGLLNAIVVDQNVCDKTAWDICLLLKERGLLCKNTQSNIIRFAPPLVMTKAEMEECIGIIKKVLVDIVDIPRSSIPGAEPTKPAPPAPVFCQKPGCGRQLKV